MCWPRDLYPWLISFDATDVFVHPSVWLMWQMLYCSPVFMITMINAADVVLFAWLRITVVQLYGSTTVVMAIYGLHWKWRSWTPCQRHPSEPIEKIFGTIDYVIDLNNLAKFGFGKIFRDRGTYTQHIRFCAFFSFYFFLFLFYFIFFITFYALWHGYSLNGWTDFDAQYLKRRRLVRGGAFSIKEKNRNLTLTFKRSKSAILFGLQNFDRHYLENGTR